jgi:hypothetical protein
MPVILSIGMELRNNKSQSMLSVAPYPVQLYGTSDSNTIMIRQSVGGMASKAEANITT